MKYRWETLDGSIKDQGHSNNVTDCAWRAEQTLGKGHPFKILTEPDKKYQWRHVSAWYENDQCAAPFPGSVAVEHRQVDC